MISSTAGKVWQFQAISSESEQIVSKSRCRVTGWQSRESWSASEPERGRRAARPSADPPRVPRCLHATVVSVFQSCGTALWASALLPGHLIGQTRGHGLFSSPAPGSIEFGGSRGTRGRQRKTRHGHDCAQGPEFSHSVPTCSRRSQPSSGVPVELRCTVHVLV